MSRLKPLAWIGWCIVLLTLPGCDGSSDLANETQSPVEVLETSIQPLALEDSAAQTRYGKVEITRSTPDMPPDTLTLDGKEVFRDEGFYIALHHYIQQEKRDLVLFSSNCGGSGCPENHFQFLVLENDAQPQLVSHDDFYGLPDDLGVQADGLKILLDLGFEAGKHKSAVLEGHNLSIVLQTAPKEYLGDENCQWLHTDGLTACIEYRDIDAKCADPQAGFAGYLMRGVAGMADFPGFTADAFNQYCVDACMSGKPAPFDTFATAVCSKP